MAAWQRKVQTGLRQRTRERLPEAAGAFCNIYSLISRADFSSFNMERANLLIAVSFLITALAYILLCAGYIYVGRINGKAAAGLFLAAAWLYSFRSFPSGLAFGMARDIQPGYEIITPLSNGLLEFLSSLPGSVPVICVSIAMRRYCRQYITAERSWEGRASGADSYAGISPVTAPGMTAENENASSQMPRIDQPFEVGKKKDQNKYFEQ